MFRQGLVRYLSLSLVAMLLLMLLVGPVVAQDETVLTFGISRRVDTLDNTATRLFQCGSDRWSRLRHPGEAAAAWFIPCGLGHQLDNQRRCD